MVNAKYVYKKVVDIGLLWYFDANQYPDR
jgi:hypothetical protein